MNSQITVAFGAKFGWKIEKECVIGVTNVMDTRPEYKVTDPVPLNQDSGLVRRGNGTSISTARLRSKLVSGRRSSAVRESRPAFFFFFFFFPPLNCEIMSFLNPVGWWSLVRIRRLFFLRGCSPFCFLTFLSIVNQKKGKSCFNRTRMAPRYLSTIRSFVYVSRVCDVSYLFDECPVWHACR